MSSNIVVIENSELKVAVNPLGAELFSVKSVKSGHEYLWQGDATYWRSRSPVLFPIVGRLCDNKCRIEGVEYAMLQHGIARHLEFEIIRAEECEVVFSLTSTAATKESYPYDFILEIGYRLEGCDVVISYRVENPSPQRIYFQLGAHPGFNYMNFDAEAEVQGYFRFNDCEQSSKLIVNMINGDGFLISEQQSLVLNEKKMPITKGTFSRDALILESTQTKDISLLDATGREYIRVKYDAPVVGLWSKSVGRYAPFVCIEPWWGRCDREAYQGEFCDKDWMHSLDAGECFQREITITLSR